MEEDSSNQNYHKIALIGGTYFVEFFEEKKKVTGKLVILDNPTKLFAFNALNEQYRFKYGQKGRTHTVSGICLAKDAFIIDERNLESSLEKAWIEAFHTPTNSIKKKINKFINYLTPKKDPFSEEKIPGVPLGELIKQYKFLRRIEK